MKGIKYTELPGFSKIFIDFINREPFFDSRFPFNSKIFHSEQEIYERSLLFQGRDNLELAVKESVKHIELSTIQKSNIEALSNSKTLVVACSGPPAFLSGPINTILKAHSAIRLAEKLSRKFISVKFIPIFWVEDDECDNLESSQASIFDNQTKIRTLSCDPLAEKTDKAILAGKYFHENIVETINNLENILPDRKFKNQIISLLKNIYEPGKSWSESFTKLFSALVGGYGLLFVNASIVRKLNLFAVLAQKELQGTGEVFSCFTRAKSLLHKYGYDIKGRVFDINLYYHQKSQRMNIETTGTHDVFEIGESLYETKDLPKIVEKRADAFSPTVILKHIFRDAVLPAAAYIASPSEIGYSSMIKEVYEYFAVPMPAFIPRHSVSFIDGNSIRSLEKKKQHPKIYEFIFPGGDHQERRICPVNFLSVSGIEGFNQYLRAVTKNEPDRHYSVSIT